MKKKQNFTLIEILTVIAIIGILAACIFPALFAVQNSSRRTKTETILTSVNSAIKVYKGDYNVLPQIRGTVHERIGQCQGDINNMVADEDYYDFFDILTYKNYKGKGAGAVKVSGLVSESNPKAVQYLDPPKDYFHEDYRLNSVRDAWNRPLLVFLDHDGDGITEIKHAKVPDADYASDSVALSMGIQDDANRFEEIDSGEIIIVK